METVKYNGWDCIRLSGGGKELLITRSVGPRIIRYGFVGGPNMMGEIPSHQGGSGESEWMNRGGHRLWIAPESPERSYELDNVPYAEASEIPGGVHLRQLPGPSTGIQKEMDVVMDPFDGSVRLHHRLTNCGGAETRIALWTINVMGIGGREIIPLPEKAPHGPDHLLPNQNLVLWSYSDLSDPRWDFGSRFIYLRQDPTASGSQKLGLFNQFGWLAYERENMLFTMRFPHDSSVEYPDMGCNCETFTNSEIIELETIGPLTTLVPGASVEQDEEWKLFGDFAPCKDEADVIARVLPLIR